MENVFSKKGKDIVCIPDAKGRKMYYKKATENLEFIGYENEMDKYIEKYKAKYPSSPLDISDCDLSGIAEINPMYHKIMKYLHTHHGSLTHRIYEFISDLLIYTNLTQENLIELFKGAFTIIEHDNWIFYNKYGKGKPCLKKQYCSSHESFHENQYRIGAGQLVNCDESGCVNNHFELILGTKEDKSTWFQFENARIDTTYNKWVLHSTDAVKYFASGKTANIGPFGKSYHTEKHDPLILRTCGTKIKSIFGRKGRVTKEKLKECQILTTISKTT